MAVHSERFVEGCEGKGGERRETGEKREKEGDIQGKKERENEGGKKGEGDSPLSMSGLNLSLKLIYLLYWRFYLTF